MREHKAFTLIELLIVVAIIGVLLAFLLTSMSQLREVVERLHCKTNLKGMHTVMMEYANRNRGYLPVFSGFLDEGGSLVSELREDAHPAGTPEGMHLLAAELKDCGADPQLFCCPAHPKYKDIGIDPYLDWETGTDEEGDPYYHTIDDKKYFPIYGYAIFTYREEWGGGRDVDGPRRFETGRDRPKRNDAAGNPPVAADVLYIDESGIGKGFWHWNDRQTLSGDPDDAELSEDLDELGGGGHTLFLNGSVQWFEYTDLANDDAHDGLTWAYNHGSTGEMKFYYVGMEPAEQ